MEVQLGLYWGNFILSALPWLIGFYMHKTMNAANATNYKFRSRYSLVWLLGLQPQKDYIYLGPAVFQGWALISFLSGFVAIYFWGKAGFTAVLYFVYFGGLAIMAIIGWIIRLANQR